MTEGKTITSSRVEFDGSVKKEKASPEHQLRVAVATVGAAVTLEKFRVNLGIPSKKATSMYALKKHSHDSWKIKAHKFFEQKWVEYTLMGLLCLDILIIFTELFLMAEYPACKFIERDCISCCPADGDYHDGDDHERWLAEAHGHGSFCYAGYDETGVASCDPHKHETVHTIEIVLFNTTVVILGIFLVENLVEMAALGPMKFFTQVFLVLDFTVVFLSFVLELVFHYLKHNFSEKATQMLIFFRIWRFIRIGHGIVEVAGELTSKQFECLFDYIKELENKLEENQVQRPERNEDVQHLIEGHTKHDHDHDHDHGH